MTNDTSTHTHAASPAADGRTPSADDLCITHPVAASPQTLRAAILNVEGWWSTRIDRDGIEFTAYFDQNWTRMRVEEFGELIRWTVTAQDTPALPDPQEWIGDVLTLEAEPAAGGGSTLRFIHYGLLAQECGDFCEPIWQDYI